MTYSINNKFKKLGSILAAAVIGVSAAFTSSITASAATTAFGQINSSKIAKTYTISTGNTIPYTSSALKTRGTEGRASGTAYIAASDELYIYKMTSTYCYVSYPVGKTRYKAYIPTSTVTSNNGDHAKSTAKGKFYTYTRSNGSGGSSSMYIENGDTVYCLSTSGSYTQLMYPVSNNTAWRIAWAKTSDYNKYCSSSSSLELVWPCQSANYITTMYRYWNSGNPKNHGVRSNIYNAFDIGGTSGDAIYAVEAGIVVDKGFQSGGFGNYVVIKHSNGLYSLYGHLKSSAVVNINATVSKKQVIGYMGMTGNSTGVHLHFELYDPNNFNRVINPWTTYYQGKVSVTVGGNSYKANSKYPSDTYAQAWCSWLKSKCKMNSAGDYVFTV